MYKVDMCVCMLHGGIGREGEGTREVEEGNHPEDYTSMNMYNMFWVPHINLFVYVSIAMAVIKKLMYLHSNLILTVTF